MATEDTSRWTCSVCITQGAYRRTPVEEAVVVGDDTILVTVDAYECIVCGNRLYDEAAGQRVQAARERLERGDIGDMRAVGTVYRAQ